MIVRNWEGYRMDAFHLVT